MNVKANIWLVIFLAVAVSVAARGGESLAFINYASVVSATPDTSQLQQLYQLMYEHSVDDEGFQYGKDLLREARAARNSNYEAEALFYLTMRCYSKSFDEFKDNEYQAIPALLKIRAYEKLFRVKSWHIYRMANNVESSDIPDSVRSLINLSDKLHFREGAEMASQALANFYFSKRFNAEGIAQYKKVLQSMKRRHAPAIKQINILVQLANYDPDCDKQLGYLNTIQNYVNRWRARGLKQFDKEHPLNYVQYGVYQQKSLAYIHKHDKAKSREYIDKADIFFEKIFSKGDQERRAMLKLKATYYEEFGDYGKALSYYQALERMYKNLQRDYSYAEVLQKIAELKLRQKGDKHSLEGYLSGRTYADSLNRSFNQQNLAQLQTELDKNKLLLENKNLKYESSRESVRLNYILLGIVVAFLISAVLTYTIISRRRMDRLLAAAIKDAEDSEKTKSVFLANMNHEIRTPLNAIVGFSQVMVDETDKEAIKEYSKIIEHNNDLLQHLIGEMLDISKIDSKSINLHYESIPLVPFIKELNCSYQLQMPPGVTFVTGDCKPVNFVTDRNCLIQILSNLINNAIKHTSSGSIKLSYEVKPRAISFVVADTGAGIPADKLESIFSRFVKLDEWTQGVGLGLSICKGLIIRMGGSIQVSSEVDKGSVFTVMLPTTPPANIRKGGAA